MSASVGAPFRSRRSIAVIIRPGVQKPHCSACSALNARWIGWSSPSFASPSTVVISAPSAWTASTVHDLTALPSIRTVHAPHWLVSQPTCVPVSLSFSRSSSTRSRDGSMSMTCSVPLTVTVILATRHLPTSSALAIGGAPCSSPAAVRRRQASPAISTGQTKTRPRSWPPSPRSARRPTLDVERFADTRTNEGRQISDVPVAVSGVKGARASIRVGHEQNEVAAAGRARPALRVAQQRCADAARLLFLGDEQEAQIRRAIERTRRDGPRKSRDLAAFERDQEQLAFSQPLEKDRSRAAAGHAVASEQRRSGHE